VGKSWKKLTAEEHWKLFCHLQPQKEPSPVKDVKRHSQRENEKRKGKRIRIEATGKTSQAVASSDCTTRRGQKRKRQETRKGQKKRKRAAKQVNPMDLYLHSIVCHLAETYEEIDLRNVSTERPEAFFAWLKMLLRSCSNRNLRTPQPFTMIICRWHAQAVAVAAKGKDATSSSLPAFKSSFEEIVIDITEGNAQDVAALLKNLQRYGYSEAAGNWTKQSNFITFNTKATTEEVFRRYGGCQ
jgi:hypothetical protein